MNLKIKNKMKTQVKAEIRDINPEQAKQFLNYNVLNRPITPKNLADSLTVLPALSI